MTRQRFIHIAAAAAALGGAAWTTKVALIAVQDGDEGSVVAFLYFSGALLVLVGSMWVGARLAGDRHPALLVALVALSPVLAFASYAVIEPLAQGVVGDAGPSWLEDEIGIVATGLFWLAVSLPVWLAPTARREALI